MLNQPVYLYIVIIWTTSFTDFVKKKEILVEKFAVKVGMHIQSSRYFDYSSFCTSRYCENFDNILLTDMRDVIFQSDPFLVSWPSDLVLAAEDPTIGEEPYNLGWLNNLYGEAWTKDFAARRVVCSGTTIGTRTAITGYLKTLCAEIERVSGPHAAHGHDQGALNYLVNTGAIDPAHIDFSDACFATIGASNSACITVDDDGIKKGGKLSPVLHQYDRHENLKQFVKSRIR